MFTYFIFIWDIMGVIDMPRTCTSLKIQIYNILIHSLLKIFTHKLLYYLEFIHCVLIQKEVNASPLPVTVSVTFVLSCYCAIKNKYVYIIYYV